MLTPRKLSFWSIAVLGSLVAPARAEDKPLRQIIDEQIKTVWKRENVTPAPQADDASFLRRIYLDLLGSIPTCQETKGFLADTDAGKRAKLIDKLLDDPRYARHQGNVWDQVLFGRHPPDSELTRRRELFQKWLMEKFAKNEPYDHWVRELLLAEGSTHDNGPTMFVAQFRGKPEEAAESVSRIFLGTQLHCARCHDHPFDKWKQVDFYGLAGFFVRLAFLEGNTGGKRHYIVGEKTTGEVMFTGPVQKQKPGQKGEPVPAKFLGGDVLEEASLPKDFKEPELKGAKSVPKPLFSRREKLVEWIVAPENPYFARAVVNRVWSQYLGRGFYQPVDNLSDDKPASHPELMQALAEQMLAHKFDIKWLIRELVNSETYQLAATGGSGEAMPRWFERGRVRPLTAEEMVSALRSLAGYENTGEKLSDKQPGPSNEYFLQYFGEPTNGRGDFQAGLGEHLFLNNSNEIRQMLTARKGNLADTLTNSKAPWEERVDTLFLAVLNRQPKPQEREKFVAHLSGDPKTQAVVDEAIWVLINCAEFRFNH